MTRSPLWVSWRACCLAILLVAVCAGKASAQVGTVEEQDGDEPLVILGTSAAEPEGKSGDGAADDTAEPTAQQPGAPTEAPVISDALQQQGFSAAVTAYRKGAYGESLDLFSLLAAGDADPARRALLHTNAGTAAARSGDLGLAIWHLEAALRSAPRDATARRNLDQVRARLGQASLAASSFTESLLRLPLWLAKSESDQLLAGLAGLALALLCLRRRAPKAAPRAALFVALVGLLAWVGFDRARERDLDRAVVVADAQVRAEPRDEGKLLFRLEVGTVVRSEENRGDWQLVETDAGGRGWAPSPSIKLAGF